MKCIEDEIPFDLPDGWAWCRVRDVASVKGGKKIPKGMSFSDCKTDHAYIRVTDMKNHSVNLDDLKYISEEVYLQIKNYTIAKDDLYVTIAGTIGVTGEVPDELDGMNLTENAVKVTEIQINKTYLCLMLQSELVQQQFQDKTHQVAMPKLALERILSTLIPICSIKSQTAICKKLAEIDLLIKLISREKDGLTDTVSKAKAKILDLAIRGQLVPQDPADEPASVLLERIRAEKEELIRQGKIKRDKKESVIFRGEDNSYYLNDGQMTADISDDLPFDIPDSWCWARLKDVLIINPRNKLDDTLDVAFIPMPLIDDGYSGKHTAEVRQWKEVKTGFTHFAEGDVGVAKITPCFENRKSTVFENLSNGYGAGTTELHILRPYGKTILAKYLLAYVKSNYFVENGKQTFTGAVGQQRIGKEYVEGAYFPIPPIKEQERIVQQINTAFECLNTIADALS